MNNRGRHQSTPFILYIAMTKEEYFGGWITVLPTKEMQEAINKVSPIKDKICPDYKNIFKAFNKCPYEKLKLIILKG